MPIKNRFAELLPEITEWRQDFHRNPELLFDTHRTAGIVADKLAAFGCDEVVTGIGRTGVVGVIKGKTDTTGNVIGLRADMDALPILEETGVDYASTTPGKMHACGHDGHTAMLLGAAKYLSETRNFNGTVVVIFQPAEEGGGGGRKMVEDGMMERFNIKEVYGMHNWPKLPIGQFAIRPGPFFAATDQFELIVEGRGGHAAKPNEAIDTTLIASHIVVALQSIVSRNIHPDGNLVVSVTSFETSSKAFNVLPQTVHIKGTIRSMGTEMRALGETRMREISAGVAATYGGTVEVIFHPGYPATVNSPEQTEFAAEVARAVSGDCQDAEITMGGEDFSYMLEKRPGAYILVGNGDTADVHHPKYNFSDETIPAGCSYWAEIVERRMPAA
jgi:hippurate hydrolase